MNVILLAVALATALPARKTETPLPPSKSILTHITGENFNGILDALSGAESVANHCAGPVVDHTACLTAALAVSTSGTVRFGHAQNYTVSTLTIPRDGMTLDLNGSTLTQKAGTANTPIIQATGRSRVSVVNGVLNGNQANVSGNLAGGVLFLNCNDVTLRALSFSDFRRIAVLLNAVSGFSVENVSGTNLGVAAASSIGQLFEVIDSTNGTIQNARVSSVYGVAGKVHTSTDITIDGYSGSGVTLDNLLTVDTSANVTIKNVKGTGAVGGSHGIEVSSSTGLAVENVDLRSFPNYGLMVNTFWNGVDYLPVVGARFSGVHTVSNGTGVRVIGAQHATFSGMKIEDSLYITDSLDGPVPAKYITFTNGSIASITVAGGSLILFDQIEGTSPAPSSRFVWVDRGAPATATQAFEAGFTGEMGVGTTQDIALPLAVGQQSNGLIIAGAWYVDSPNTQYSANIYNIAIQQDGTMQIAEMSSLDGATPRALTFSAVNERTLRLTNGTGVGLFVNVRYLGSGGAP